MTEPAIGDGLSDQEGDAGPAELDPDTAADYGDGAGGTDSE